MKRTLTSQKLLNTELLGIPLHKINIYCLMSALMLTLLAINPGITQGASNINLLLCTALFLSPLTLFLRKGRVWMPRIDLPLSMLCVSVLICPIIFHPHTVRFSTMLFTSAYCVYIAMLARMLNASELNAEGFLKLIRGIVYAFFIVLCVQQLCVLTGLPVFFAAKVYGMPWKLNSLTAEPSHTSITLCFLMFIYMQTRRYISQDYTLAKSFSREWMLWSAWVWTIFSTINASAFVFAPLAFLPFITRKNVWVFLGVAICCVEIFMWLPESIFEQPHRVKNIVMSLLSLDQQKIIEADESISTRVIPTIRGAEALTIGPELLIGHGVDASTNDIEDIPYDDIYDKGSAGIFNMLYNYGLIGALSLLWIMGRMILIKRYPLTWITFIIALILSQEYNMQLIWLVIAYGMVFKYRICHKNFFSHQTRERFI